MDVTAKHIRKVLNKKILQLNDMIADIDHLLTQMETDYYRVSIFGSARITQESELYQEVYRLAYQLALKGVDIVTGGGPGLMDAANKGGKDGGQKTRSIGLPIELPFEEDSNEHLDVKRHHRRFSSRLDEFMRISHAVVVTPGGIGTLLEFFYTWQLLQVKHIKPRPIIMMGGGHMWAEFIQWIEKWPLQLKLISPLDMEHVIFCHTIEEVLEKLEPDIVKFNETKENKKKQEREESL